MKKTVISESNIAGWGLFALERIRKGEFIAEYVGEVSKIIIKIITQEEADRREIINEMDKSTYMFNLNNEVKS
jgi:SET domain-containing protein